MLNDVRHKTHCGDEFIFKNHQEGINKNDMHLHRSLLNLQCDCRLREKAFILRNYFENDARHTSLFTQEVHLTVWIYELAVWTKLLTTHIVRGGHETINLHKCVRHG